MHCSMFEIEGGQANNGGEILVKVAALVTEGRIPGKTTSAKTRGFHEGPHCQFNQTPLAKHNCDATDPLCLEYEKVRVQVLELWQKGIPLCVEVLLGPGCSCAVDETGAASHSTSDSTDSGLLLEQWFINVNHRRIHDKTHINLPQLLNAVRSQLHFSQITAWLSSPDTTTTTSTITKKNIIYRLSLPGETPQVSQFTSAAIKHDFPITDIGHGLALQVSLLSLPRLPAVPHVKCAKCEPDLDIIDIDFRSIEIAPAPTTSSNCKPATTVAASMLFTERMLHTVVCTQKGKHRCEDFNVFDCRAHAACKPSKYQRGGGEMEANLTFACQPSTSGSYAAKPSLCVDLNRALNNVEMMGGGEKRNLSPNEPQKAKNFKLDLFGDGEDDDDEEGEEDGETEQTCRKKYEAERAERKVKCAAMWHAREDLKRKGRPQWETFAKRWNHLERGLKQMNGFARAGPNAKQQQPQQYLNECRTQHERDSKCDRSGDGDISSFKRTIYVDAQHCDSPMPRSKHNPNAVADVTNVQRNNRVNRVRQKLQFDGGDGGQQRRDACAITSDRTAAMTTTATIADLKEDNLGVDIPTPLDQAKFRKSLDNATCMVFHTRTGLPLTSSPAPVRRGKSCFDFDCSITSVSAIGNALFSLASDEESESDGSIVSPSSPDAQSPFHVRPEIISVPKNYYRRRRHNSLLGTFEESVLNGRLDPVSTVEGFSAELGASGLFVPKHTKLPVTVFFYNLGDQEKVLSPYLAHINLGRKGYQVPKSGTVQVTLFNPLGTVVKMFVIAYDLSEMPPNCQTFIRQKTLYTPMKYKGENIERQTKWLRYLIHLRFMSSKSGRIYLHSDIRMIIFRKSDVDTAAALGLDSSYESRSFTYTPTDPRFCARS